MKPSPLSIFPPAQPAQHGRETDHEARHAARMRPPAQKPRFSGLGDAAASLVGAMDKNRMFELMASDGIGMILPRTALALKYRGTDDCRETFFRESSGLIGNIFLSGWLGYGATRLLGDHVNPYNPKGMPGRAWITAPNLEAFGKIYQNELMKAGNAQEARSAFIHRILEGLTSDDRHFSIESRLSNLEKMDRNTQINVLKKMAESVPDQHAINLAVCENLLDQTTRLKDALKGPEQKEAYQKLRGQIKEQFLNAGWGKLSPTARKNLAEYFELQKPGSGIKGTKPLDEEARQRLLHQQMEFARNHGLEDAAKQTIETAKQLGKSDDVALANLLKPNGFDSEKAFVKHRLELSVGDLRNAKAFQTNVDAEALRYGLTGTVDLEHTFQDNRKIALSTGRANLLKEVKHFLEQFVDRASNQATREAGNSSHWGEIQQKIQHLLNAPSKPGLYQLIPQETDGLITSAMKSKGAYTWLPIALCMVAAGGFTFYNNYLTMKKYGGKIFFPGEGVPPMTGEQPAAEATPTHSLNKSFGGGVTGLYRNFGNFPNYPQFKNSQGGIIA